MSAKEVYESWLSSPVFNEETKNELRSIAGNDAEIEDRFYRNLKFGTGGLRGVIGAGTNRMNVYTVTLATQGLANYILKQGPEAAKKGVIIAHDPRHYSREFSQMAAGILAANGIKAYVFPDLRPTPELAFLVRELGTISGINITASHNPRDYNGYKV
jgi:phosphoglucomutase